MNSYQKNNQSNIANCLLNGRIIKSCNIKQKKVIITCVSWDKYWDCIEKHEELITKAYIDFKNLYYDFCQSKFDRSFYKRYYISYINVFNELLNGLKQDKMMYFEPFQKLMMFGNFAIENETHEVSAACVFNLANPNYIISRIIKSTGLQDSKFLPFILLSKNPMDQAELFCHYRQVPLQINKESRLFFYFPEDIRIRYNAFSYINNFINAIYNKRDPFVKERAKYISERIIEKLLKRLYMSDKKTFRILDIGGGSGILVMKILDIISRKFPNLIEDNSIEWTIIECPRIDYTTLFSQKVFCSKILKFLYIKSDFKKWLANNWYTIQMKYDLVFACRIINNTSSISIEFMRRETQELPLNRNEAFNLQKFVEKSTKMSLTPTRTRYKQGYIYKQFLNEHYYRGLYIVQNHIVPSNENIYFPFRKINLETLVINSEKSLIEILCKIGRYVIIEDIDLDYRDLIEHLKLFGVRHLVIRDLTSVLKLTTSHLFCISETY